MVTVSSHVERPMKIAMLSWESLHSIRVGGIAPHVTELAMTLHRRGHDVHIFTRRGEGQKRYERIDGVHYHRCPFEPHADFVTSMARMSDSFVWHLGEVEHGYGEPFDIIHGHDWLVGNGLVRIKNESHRPTVLTIHSTEYGRCGNELFWHGQSQQIRSIEWESTYVADRVICVSESLRQEVQWLYSVPPDKSRAIYNGVDVARFDADVDVPSIRRAHAIRRHDPCVLFAGRMAWQKGPDLLVEAMSGVLKRHPDTKFVFAGEGDMRAELEDRVVAKGTASATRFLGYRTGTELVGLFKSADVVCVPSRNEPFGIVILEAWSASKPVVATRTGGPAEFVRDEDTGLTVAGTVDSIGQGIESMLSDEVAARRMGVNGRREAETRFSWDTIAAQTEAVYHSIVGTDGVATVQAITGAMPKEVTMARKQEDQFGEGIDASARTTVSAPSCVPDRTERGALQRVAGGPIQPAADEIRRRAYEIYLARNGAPGDPASDWLHAERELREGRATTAARRPKR